MEEVKEVVVGEEVQSQGDGALGLSPDRRRRRRVGQTQWKICGEMGRGAGRKGSGVARAAAERTPSC